MFDLGGVGSEGDGVGEQDSEDWLLLLLLLFDDEEEDDGDDEVELDGPLQSVTCLIVKAVGHGATDEHPPVQDHVLKTVATGSGQPQPAVRVERMTQGGNVHEAGQTVEVDVTVGQPVTVGIGTPVISWAATWDMMTPPTKRI